MSGSQAPEQLKQSMPQQQQHQQNQQPLKRQIPFSMKPPFMAPGGDYHRFASTEPCRIANQEAEAIVVKSPVGFFLLRFKFFNLRVLCLLLIMWFS